MKALCWHGTNDIRCESVPDPKIEDGRDVIIKVTSCAICGSDLHLMDGLMPTMKSGDILGHEFMGEVVETGSAHIKFRKGDRIVVPFNINCGECRQCKLSNYSVCQRSNRNAAMAAAQLGYRTAGLLPQRYFPNRLSSIPPNHVHSGTMCRLARPYPSQGDSNA